MNDCPYCLFDKSTGLDFCSRCGRALSIEAKSIILDDIDLFSNTYEGESK